MRRKAAASVFAVAGLIAACSSSRIEGGVFHSAKGYTVSLPGEGWRVERGGLADLELKREAPPGGMLADATCEGGERAPRLPVLARHLTFGLTDRVTLESDVRTVDGRPAEHRVVRGVVDGAPVGVEAVVVDGERCIHDFLYVAPIGPFEAGRRDFQAFVESLSGRVR